MHLLTVICSIKQLKVDFIQHEWQQLLAMRQNKNFTKLPFCKCAVIPCMIQLDTAVKQELLLAVSKATWRPQLHCKRRLRQNHITDTPTHLDCLGCGAILKPHREIITLLLRCIFVADKPGQFVGHALMRPLWMNLVVSRSRLQSSSPRDFCQSVSGTIAVSHSEINQHTHSGRQREESTGTLVTEEQMMRITDRDALYTAAPLRTCLSLSVLIPHNLIPYPRC